MTKKTEQPSVLKDEVVITNDTADGVITVTSRIRVLYHYRGRLSNEQVIPPGDYDLLDEALLGLGSYLVSIGAAEQI